MVPYETKSMSIRREIKSQLAKLLATEDLVVEHKHVETAQFNVQTRVLTLPIWDKASGQVYDMLVGHEVGHALFTPNEDPPANVPHQLINIVEDVRIEKMMKRKYPGLSKTFYRGYKELSDEDFFCLENEDVSEMNLADRVNLHFKIGNFIDVGFAQKETDVVKLIANTETFEDVIVAAEELHKLCKSEKEMEKVADIQESQSGGQQTDSESEKSDKVQPQIVDGQGSSGEQEEDSDADWDAPTSGSGSDSKDDEDIEVKTADALDDKLRDLISESALDSIYVELPEVNLDTILIKNEKVHKETDLFFEHQQKRFESSNMYEKVDSEYVEFKRSAQKEVNYLVKEFECKKAADSYARATTSRTGVLDCTKLHTYKYNEDMFKKVTTLSDGKNHGLVFVLDWSGSMSKVLKDTVKQLYNLIWFCKKVSIPFEVYAFTCEWHRDCYDYELGKYISVDPANHYERKDGILHVSEHFSLMNILSSKTSVKELESHMVNMWRIAHYFSSGYGCGYDIPNRLSLSGTPLNESIVALHRVIPEFQKQNKVQKVQCIILTDGEAPHLLRHVAIDTLDGLGQKKSYIGTRRLSAGNTFIRDRKLGRTYRVGYSHTDFAGNMLRNLKDNFPYVNLIGIRVLPSREANYFMKQYCSGKELEQLQREWKKQKSFCIKNSGYDAYFGLSSSTLSQDSEFEVKVDATKTQIKSAFMKSLKTKKLNKKVLGEFVELIA